MLYLKIRVHISKSDFFIAVHVLRPDGTEANHNELGRIVCKLPLPPGTMSTLYKASERFLQVYFSKYPVSHDLFLNSNVYKLKIEKKNSTHDSLEPVVVT